VQRECDEDVGECSWGIYQERHSDNFRLGMSGNFQLAGRIWQS